MVRFKDKSVLGFGFLWNQGGGEGSSRARKRESWSSEKEKSMTDLY